MNALPDHMETAFIDAFDAADADDDVRTILATGAGQPISGLPPTTPSSASRSIGADWCQSPARHGACRGSCRCNTAPVSAALALQLM